jgi:hypothetical protein
MLDPHVTTECLPVTDGSLREGDSVGANIKIYLYVSRYHQVVAKKRGPGLLQPHVSAAAWQQFGSSKVVSTPSETRPTSSGEWDPPSLSNAASADRPWKAGASCFETTKTLPKQGSRVVRRQGFEPRTR